jgi:hypothetical protein
VADVANRSGWRGGAGMTDWWALALDEIRSTHETDETASQRLSHMVLVVGRASPFLSFAACLAEAVAHMQASRARRGPNQ